MIKQVFLLDHLQWPIESEFQYIDVILQFLT